MKIFWLGTITAICLLLGSTAYAGDRHRHHDHGHRDRYEHRHYDRHHHRHHHYRPQSRYYYGPAPRYYHPGYYRPAPRYYGPVHDRYYRDGVGGHVTVHF